MKFELEIDDSKFKEFKEKYFSCSDGAGEYTDEETVKELFLVDVSYGGEIFDFRDEVIVKKVE